MVQFLEMGHNENRSGQDLDSLHPEQVAIAENLASTKRFHHRNLKKNRSIIIS